MPLTVPLLTEAIKQAIIFAQGTPDVDISRDRFALKFAEILSVNGEGSIWFTGSGAPANDLGNVGDFYLDYNSGDFYEKTATTTWTLRGNLMGPAGSPGGGITELKDAFNPTLGQTVFTLTATPSVGSNVEMRVNGLKTYSFNRIGVTITYTGSSYSLSPSDLVEFTYT